MWDQNLCRETKCLCKTLVMWIFKNLNEVLLKFNLIFFCVEIKNLK
jgi:hypothetical protein